MGSVYDMALAAAVLSAHGKKEWERLEKTVLLGELALDGRVRPVKGVLPAVLAAKREGWPAVVVPADNLAEASLVDGIEVLGCADAGATAGLARGQGAAGGADRHAGVGAGALGRSRRRRRTVPRAVRRRGGRRGRAPSDVDRPPGCRQNDAGTTASGPAARRCRDSEALEVTAIHSVAGLLSGDTPLITRPPFVAPHHTSSVAALVGGGTGMARPGAVSRAHRGVLFLDECAEIGASALEALRTPLEDGEIRLARRDGVARYPARFQLVLAANPCPCAPADPARLHLCRRPSNAAIWASCRARCWTASTCACRCIRYGQGRSRPRRANRRSVRHRVTAGHGMLPPSAGGPHRIPDQCRGQRVFVTSKVPARYSCDGSAAQGAGRWAAQHPGQSPPPCG